MHVACFHLDGRNANHVANIVANQIHCQPLNEKGGFFFNVLLIQRVQHGVAGAVGCGAGALN